MILTGCMEGYIYNRDSKKTTTKHCHMYPAKAKIPQKQKFHISLLSYMRVVGIKNIHAKNAKPTSRLRNV